MPKISIIIPVYNSEKYLEECLNSVISQNESDCEIILINDGSKDSSLAICKKFAEIDNRIIVIDKENGGVSSARNIGLEIASGEFVAFVDSDDYVGKEIYSSVFEKFGEQFDIAIIGGVYNAKKEIKEDISFLKDEYTNESIKICLMPEFYCYGKGFQKRPLPGHIYRMICKRSLIGETKFSTEIKYSEDLLFCLICLRKAKKVVVDKSYRYFYRINTDSVTGKLIENFENDIEILGEKIKLELSGIHIEHDRFAELSFFNIVTFIKNLSDNKSFLFCVKKLRESMDAKFFCDTINKVNPGLLPFKYRYLLFLAKHKMFFLLFFTYKIRYKLFHFLGNAI